MIHGLKKIISITTASSRAILEFLRYRIERKVGVIL